MVWFDIGGARSFGLFWSEIGSAWFFGLFTLQSFFRPCLARALLLEIWEGQFEDQKQRPRSHHNQNLIRPMRLLDNYTYSFYRHGFVVGENLERIKIQNKTLQPKILN